MGEGRDKRMGERGGREEVKGQSGAEGQEEKKGLGGR